MTGHTRSYPDTAGLADELTKWVEQYALKVCPPGCLPLPAQEREINLFARIAIALRAPAVISEMIEVATREDDDAGIMEEWTSDNRVAIDGWQCRLADALKSSPDARAAVFEAARNVVSEWDRMNREELQADEGLEQAIEAARAALSQAPATDGAAVSRPDGNTQ